MARQAVRAAALCSAGGFLWAIAAAATLVAESWSGGTAMAVMTVVE